MSSEKKPNFLSYRVNDIKRKGSRYTNLSPGDFILDESNILGIVKFDSGWGDYVEFIDGFTIYDNPSLVDLGLKKSPLSSTSIYEYVERQFGFIVGVARIASSSLSEKFAYVSMFNNGKNVYVRASSSSSLISGYTTMDISQNIDFLSIKFTPRYDMEIETFAIRKTRRRSSWATSTLRELFIDLDLNITEEQKRMKINITDEHPYNEELFERAMNEWKKFNIVREG
jgi:hypothetical protein